MFDISKKIRTMLLTVILVLALCPWAHADESQDLADRFVTVVENYAIEAAEYDVANSMPCEYNPLERTLQAAVRLTKQAIRARLLAEV